MKHDVPPEFGELAVLSWIGEFAVLVSTCGNVLPVWTLPIAEVFFCSTPSTEPSPLLADVALPLAYVDLLHDAVDL